MSKFIVSLDDAVGKTAYQVYTIEHGIERIAVQVPLRNAREFEADFGTAGTTDRAAILKMVAEHGGKVRI